MFPSFCKAMNDLAGKSFKDAVTLFFKLSEPSTNRSARLEIDTEEFVAEIVVWESGDYIAEIVDAVTEESVFRLAGDLPNQSFQETFRYFFSKLNISLD